MKIITKHPDPNKQGVKIDKDKYNQVKTAILDVLSEKSKISFKELAEYSKHKLTDFNGSKGWYITTVKLDLEAQNIISVERSTSPQQISITQK